MIPRLALPPSPAALALIALAFVLPGLLHQPWKSVDVVTLAVSNEMLLSGDWLLPRLAGQLWLDDMPLYHWVALGFGAALGWLLQFHEAARLASGLFVLLAIGLVYQAAARWAAPEERRFDGAAAALLLVGSVGLMVHAHEAVPELAALAALAGAFAALARSAQQPRNERAALGWGAAFGAALGAEFLASGFVVPAAIFAAALLAHLVCEAWRSRRALLFLGAAAVVAAAIVAGWLTGLALRAPAAPAAWWALATQLRGAFDENLRYYLGVASWFAWPAWPLALWAIWSLRRRWREPQLFMPLAATVLGLLGISLIGPTQTVNALALLVPLALLAVRGAAVLRRGAAAALDWFGVMTFGVFAALVWLGYVAMMTGVPPRIAHNFLKVAPGFVAHFDARALLGALALSLAWFYLVFFTQRSAARSLVRWAAGVMLLWGTFATLWMPWADYQKSYRSVALQLRSKIPAGDACLAGMNLGAPQRAALDYHAGIRAREFDLLQPNPCPLLLVQGHPSHERDRPGAGWSKLADVGRPGDKSERYRLYGIQR